MTAFIAIAVLLTLLVLAWLLRPLLRPTTPGGVSSERLNAEIYRDQLAALERDVARGAISPTDFETTRDELQLRLLDDTQGNAALPPTTGWWTPRRSAGALTLLLPLCAGALYAWLGTPAAIDPVLAQKAQQDQVLQMVESLAAKLKANPNNPKGWAMLARSYKVMGRFDEAEAAFKQAGDLLASEPDLMVDYADLLAVRAGNHLEGAPLALVKKALALDPNHPMGLMMSGVAAYRRDDFKVAVQEWEKLLSVLEPGSPDALQVQTDIEDARAKAGLPPTQGVSVGAAVAGAGTDLGKLPPVDPAMAGQMTPEKINEMVQRLADRLQANPDDLPGWLRLARAYKVQGKLDLAEQAFEKAIKLVNTDADLLTQYADLIASRSNTLQGRPTELVNKALALNAKHPMALMLAGTAAFQRNDFKQAVAHWEKALAVLPAGSQDAKLVQQEIADARAKGGIKP